MAEECRVGVHSGETLAEVCEKGHTRHRIWGKIQEAEAKGLHDVTKEIGEGRTKPAGKIVDKKGYRFGAASVSRRILVVPIVSFSSSASTSLQSLMRTGGARRTSQNAGGSFSSI